MDAYDIIAKVVMVGDSCVGKTCMILRYSQDIFRENFLSTIGVDFKTKTIYDDGRKIKLQLWDTAGQERYDSLRKGFYRGAKGVVVVYDITSEQSFENVTKWLDDITANTNEQECPALAVVGNKLDLDSHRQVPSHLGEEVARKANATFGEVSAKTGEGIEVVLNEFVKQVLAHIDNSASSNAITSSIDVSKDWTENKQSQCCVSQKRRSQSSLDQDREDQ